MTNHFDDDYFPGVVGPNDKKTFTNSENRTSRNRNVSQTLRLDYKTWILLKEVALERNKLMPAQRVTVHDLLLEAVDDLIERSGRPRPTR